MKEFIREACVEGFDQALKAQLLGADRIELCARLDLDGLTPNKETIVQAVSQLTIPIRVMVRLRGGDFHYSSEEIKQMLETIRFCRTLGVEGVVFGTLNHENEVDLALTNQLVEAAGSLKTVFHRAIESTSDIARSVDLLNKETDISAILVSGTGGGKASDHVPELQDLIHCFGERELVVCGKVTDQNVEQLHQEIGAKAYHGKLIVGNLI
ncbi:MAG: copper homeostasis protein CutC [Cytophagales bacterium]|nr:copper homeostasis protein CutC [Cytophagales bacterium]